VLLDPPQALPNATYYIYRYLLDVAPKHGASKAEIIHALAPSTLVPNDAVCRFSVEVGSRLGLWIEDAATGNPRDGRPAADGQDEALVVLSPDLQRRSPKELTDRRSFRLLLRRHVFEPDLNRGPWLSQAGAYDFTCAIAWLLAQEVSNPPGTWESTMKPSLPSVQRSQIEQLGNSQEVWLIKNETRWDPFVRWALFLGFIGRQVLDGKVLVVPSPVDAVSDALSVVFAKGGSKKELPAEIFVEALAAELPVVDRGRYRQEVMTHISAGIRIPEETQLSSSLSHALLILHQRGDITLDDRADAPKLALTNGPPDLTRFSHVRIGGDVAPE
jgi:hypothetical protein